MSVQQSNWRWLSQLIGQQYMNIEYLTLNASGVLAEVNRRQLDAKLHPTSAFNRPL